MTHLLSKSKYIRGLQCDRALWLDVHAPRLARYTREQMLRFGHGREFEHTVKQRLAQSNQPAPQFDLSAELGRNVDAYPERTAAIIGSHNAATLFEAGFLYDDVLVLADTVILRHDGSLDVYEIKSGTALSDTYRHDAALQHYVISNCHSVNSFSIVYAKENETGRDVEFTIVELTDALKAEAGDIARHIAQMKTIALATAEPDTPTGQHCLAPYACPYQHHCQQGVRQLALF